MRHGLQLAQQTVVVGVRSDPEPDEDVAVAHGESPMSEPHSGRVDRASRMHLLEPQTRVSRVVLELPVGLSGATLDVVGQVREGATKTLGGPGGQSRSGSSGFVRPARCSRSASSASDSSAPGEDPSAASQRSSAATSSRMAAASASCSRSGREDAISKAFFSACVMTPFYTAEHDSRHRTTVCA